MQSGNFNFSHSTATSIPTEVLAREAGKVMSSSKKKSPVGLAFPKAAGAGVGGAFQRKPRRGATFPKAAAGGFAEPLPDIDEDEEDERDSALAPMLVSSGKCNEGAREPAGGGAALRGGGGVAAGAAGAGEASGFPAGMDAISSQNVPSNSAPSNSGQSDDGALQALAENLALDVASALDRRTSEERRRDEALAKLRQTERERNEKANSTRGVNEGIFGPGHDEMGEWRRNKWKRKNNAGNTAGTGNAGPGNTGSSNNIGGIPTFEPRRRQPRSQWGHKFSGKRCVANGGGGVTGGGG